MTRQTIDNTGKWFDVNAATKYEEAARWDGRNMVSVATGDQWEHEALYRTKGGRWVLNHWSQWQGSSEAWTEISATEAAAWLTANGGTDASLAAEVAAAEV